MCACEGVSLTLCKSHWPTALVTEVQPLFCLSPCRIPPASSPQAWEVHNSQQRHQRQHQQQPQHTSAATPTADADSPSATAVAAAADPPHAAAAAAALAKWARVGRRSRGALKKASLHSVMSLEVQVLDLLEQVGYFNGMWWCG